MDDIRHLRSVRLGKSKRKSRWTTRLWEWRICYGFGEFSL